jgi:hypothetical protein
MNKKKFIKSFQKKRENTDEIIDRIKPRKWLYSEKEIRETYQQILAWFPDVRRKLVKLEIPLITWPQYIPAYSTNFKPAKLITGNCYDRSDFLREFIFEIVLAIFLIGFAILGVLNNSVIILIIVVSLFTITVWTGAFTVNMLIRHRFGLKPIPKIQKGYTILIPRHGFGAYKRYNLMEAIIHELCHVRNAIKGNVANAEATVEYETREILDEISAYAQSKVFIMMVESGETR